MELSILLVGFGGFIGGSVFTRLRKTYPRANITVFVRVPEHVAPALVAGADRVVYGSYEDIACAANKADVVFNAAVSDDIHLVETILDGLSARHAIDGIRPIFIQVGSIPLDAPRGAWNDEVKIWDDNSASDIRTLTFSDTKREVVNRVLNAHASGIVDGYIVATSVVYGQGSGPIRKSGLIYRVLVNSLVPLQHSAHIGQGTNRWNFVHIDDLVELFMRVLDNALKKGSDRSPQVYFAASEWYTMKEVMENVGKTLHSMGLLPTTRCDRITLADAIDIDGHFLFTASNSICQVNRSRLLGWEPVHKGRLMEFLSQNLTDALKWTTVGQAPT